MTSHLLDGRPITNVFGLLGRDENAMTYALGWCTAQVRPLLAAIATTLSLSVPGEHATVLLQQHGGRHGITDIEIWEPGRRVWIVEAKAGFAAPSIEQLEKYAARLNELHEAAAERVLIVLAQSDRRELWLRRTIPNNVCGIPVRVLLWRLIRACVDEAWPFADNTGKALLRQLSNFLQEVIGMQIATSNEVYVVALNREIFGGTTTFLDVVEKHGRYFHPVGATWPVSLRTIWASDRMVASSRSTTWTTTRSSRISIRTSRTFRRPRWDPYPSTPEGRRSGPCTKCGPATSMLPAASGPISICC